MAIADKILELRKNKNMTQRELAEKLNVSDNVISRWETGKTRPDVDMMKTISDVLDVPIQELYDSIDPTAVNNIEKYDNDAIFKFKKYVIFSIFTIIFSCFIFFYMAILYRSFIKYDSNNESIRLIFPSALVFLASLVGGTALFLVQFVYLFDIQRRMFYKKEYRKAMIKYGIIFIVVFIVALIFISSFTYLMLRD